MVFSFSSEHNIVHLYPLCDNIMFTDGVMEHWLGQVGQAYMMCNVLTGHKYNYI